MQKDTVLAKATVWYKLAQGQIIMGSTYTDIPKKMPQICFLSHSSNPNKKNSRFRKQIIGT